MLLLKYFMSAHSVDPPKIGHILTQLGKVSYHARAALEAFLRFPDTKLQMFKVRYCNREVSVMILL